MKLFKKIDLYYNGDYICSTMQSKTCKAAVQAYFESPVMQPRFQTLVGRLIAKNPKLLKARFAK